MSSIVVPILMNVGFLLYPTITYKYTMKKSDELLSFDESSQLYLRHRAFFSSFKITHADYK